MFGWIKDLFSFWKLRHDLLKEYKQENLIERFSQLYQVPFRVDRAARLYAVMNPMLMNLKSNNTSQIFEYTQTGMSDMTYIKQWVYTKLLAVEKMFAAENLLDVLVPDIRIIDYDGKPSGNYLVIFSPYNFEDYLKARNKLIILILIILLLTIATLIIL